jgi:uncharacterized protein (DUF1697 family)
MEELRKHFELPGFERIVSYIQSGNILFDSKEKKADLLRKNIEQTLEKKLGYAVPVIVRSLDEMKAVIERNPFDMPAEGGKARLYVCFLSAIPAAGLVAAFEANSNESEQVKVINSEVYLLTDSYGSTKFPNTFVEKKLGVQSTVRNWNTVNKVLAL